MGHRRISVRLGNALGAAGTVIALSLPFIAQSIQSDLPRFLFYLLSVGCLEFFPHGLAHFLVGRTVGIKFRYYFWGRSGVARLHLPLISGLASLMPVLTLKVSKLSLQSVSRARRAAMYASGAVASMCLPLIPIIMALGHLSTAQSGVLLLLALLNMALDLYYSPRAGDLARARSSLLT